jgi:hypothetical protein
MHGILCSQVGADGTTAKVRRDPKYQNNDILPYAHSKKVGERILQYMYDTYPDTILPSNKTIPSEVALANFVKDAQLLMDVFSFNSYALNIQVSGVERNPDAKPVSGSDTREDIAYDALAGRSKRNRNLDNDFILVRLSLRAPANLWSAQVLNIRNDQPHNDFEVKILRALADSKGLRLSVVNTNVYNKIDVEYMLKVGYA